MERVLAVRLSAEGQPQFFDAADQWLDLADTSNAIRTTELWETHFQNWSDPIHTAQAAAVDGFASLAAAFVSDRSLTLTRERVGQVSWLQQRADEITGVAGRRSSVQRRLFDDAEEGPSEEPIAAWQAITEPNRRLAAFHADRSQAPSARAEADGALRIYQQRLNHLDALCELRPPEIVPLGVLMLIPEVQHDA